MKLQEGVVIEFQSMYDLRLFVVQNYIYYYLKDEYIVS